MIPPRGLGQSGNRGQLGDAMTNASPRLPLAGVIEARAASVPKKKIKRRPKAPTGLYRPPYVCKKCDVCVRRKAKQAKKGERCLEPKRVRTWWYRKSIRGVRRKPVSTGCTDLRNAIEVAAQLRDEWERQAVGLKRRGRMSIEEAKEGFRKYLTTQKGSPQYIDTQMGYLDEVLIAAGIRFVDELDEGVFADWLPIAKKKRLRARGKNVRLYPLKRLGEWLLKKGECIDPFALLVPYDEEKDRAHVRRAMWPGECARFLKAVRTRQIERAREYRVRAGLSRGAMIKMRREGRVRALVYNTVAQTGLRRKETRLLLIKNVDFDAGVIWIPQGVAKSRHEQYVRLNSDLARRLKSYLRTLGDVSDESPLFPATRTHSGKRAPKSAVPTIKTFDKDLEAAGLPKKDARDRVLDFHALRMTYITHLRVAGVELGMAKRLARHSDIKLTEDIYTDFDLMAGPEREAAEMLVPERRRQRFVPEVR